MGLTPRVAWAPTDNGTSGPGATTSNAPTRRRKSERDDHVRAIRLADLGRVAKGVGWGRLARSPGMPAWAACEMSGPSLRLSSQSLSANIMFECIVFAA